MVSLWNEVWQAIERIGLPHGCHGAPGPAGPPETKGYVFSALGLTVILIYLGLASLFASFHQPLVTMLALRSASSAVFALLATRGGMNVTTMIGIIVLAGLATKHGILLVGFTNQRPAEGRAIIDGLMTSTLLTMFAVSMMYTNLDAGSWVATRLTGSVPMAVTAPTRTGAIPEAATGD